MPVPVPVPAPIHARSAHAVTSTFAARAGSNPGVHAAAVWAARLMDTPPASVVAVATAAALRKHQKVMVAFMDWWALAGGSCCLHGGCLADSREPSPS